MDSDVQNCVSSHSHDQGYAGRIDVVPGPTGRRRWPEDVKAAMVLETFRDGATVADAARKHGISAPQLHACRRYLPSADTLSARAAVNLVDNS